MDKMDSNIMWHIGIIVRDIEKKAQNYADIFGMKVPPIISVKPKELTWYKGKELDIQHKMVFFKMGLVQIELIEPNEEESSFREFLDKHGEGIHHVTFNVKDMNETTEFLGQKGIDVVQKGDFEGGCYAYVDATEQLGAILELYQKNK